MMSLLVLSWSTCPALYVNSVRTLVGAEVHACAGSDAGPACCLLCQRETCQHEAPDTSDERGPKRCPLCEKIGSMHALVVLDAPAALAVPLLTAEFVVVTLALAPLERAAERLEQVVSPPDEQFTTTVRFLC